MLAWRRYDTLSGGQQQRVLLARALASEPDILVLDEPMSGMDITGEADLLAFLSHLQRQRGMTMLMVARGLTKVAGCADRLCLLNKDSGLFVIGAREALLNTERLSALYERPIEVPRANGATHIRVREAGHDGDLVFRKLLRVAGCHDRRRHLSLCLGLSRRVGGAERGGLRSPGLVAGLVGGRGDGLFTRRLVRQKRHRRKRHAVRRSGFRVVAYLIASAGVLLLGGFVRQDLHDMAEHPLRQCGVGGDDPDRLRKLGGLDLALLVHGLGYRSFLFAGFNPDSYGASGLSRFRAEFWLYMTFAVMISVATRAIGALPSFGLMILPALVGLRVGRGMAGAFAWAMVVGAASAAIGYYLSFVWELPTGPCMVAVAGVALACATLIGKRRR